MFKTFKSGQRDGTDGNVLPDRYQATAVHFTHPRDHLDPVRSRTHDVCNQNNWLSKLMKRTPAIFTHGVEQFSLI